MKVLYEDEQIKVYDDNGCIVWENKNGTDTGYGKFLNKQNEGKQDGDRKDILVREN